MKNIIIIFLFSIMMLFFASCENGVSFDPSEINNGGTDTEIPDGGGDGDGNGDGDGDGDGTPDGTGTHSFKLDFTHITDSLPENFKFKPLQVKYAGITDTTGKGITVTFNLSIDVPDVLEATPPVPEDENVEDENIGDESQKRLRTSGETPPPPPVVDVPLVEGDQDIKVTITTYEKKEGIDEFPTAYFIDSADSENIDLKEFTFTPENDTVALTVIYPDVLTMQKGILPIKFTSVNNKFNDVYKNTMPRELNLSVYSKGTAVTSRVVPDTLEEQTDDTAIEIFKPESDYVLTIKDETKVTTEQGKEIPLVLNLLGVKDDYPVTITPKDSDKLIVSNIVVEGGKATFTATHSGIKKMQSAEGTVTLTINSAHTDVYTGLPFDIVIKTKRNESFKHYIDEYDDNFTVSTSGNSYFDNGYYTAVRIQGMNILEATPEDKVTYEIFRKDDSSADFKSIFARTVSANQTFVFKDRNAFILRNHEQEYKIKIKHDTCTNDNPCTSVFDETTPTQKGSRLLTERETLIATMETIRRAINWSQEEGDNFYYFVEGAAGDWNMKNTERQGITGTYYHGIERHCAFATVYRRYQRFDNYRNSFVTLNGTFMKDNGWGTAGKLSGTWAHSGIRDCGSGICNTKTVWTMGKNGGADKNLKPRTDELTVSYSGVDTKIVFDKIVIDNHDKNSPAWSSGSFKINGEEYGSRDVPFGFFMDAATFKNKLLDKDGNYTQK